MGLADVGGGGAWCPAGARRRGTPGEGDARGSRGSVSLRGAELPICMYYFGPFSVGVSYGDVLFGLKDLTGQKGRDRQVTVFLKYSNYR